MVETPVPGLRSRTVSSGSSLCCVTSQDRVESRWEVAVVPGAIRGLQDERNGVMSHKVISSVAGSPTSTRTKQRARIGRARPQSQGPQSEVTYKKENTQSVLVTPGRPRALLGSPNGPLAHRPNGRGPGCGFAPDRVIPPPMATKPSRGCLRVVELSAISQLPA